MNYEEAKKQIDDMLLEIVREAAKPGIDGKERQSLDLEYDRLVYAKSATYI